jgi:hypothetical protein
MWHNKACQMARACRHNEVTDWLHGGWQKIAATLTGETVEGFGGSAVCRGAVCYCVAVRLGVDKFTGLRNGRYTVEFVRSSSAEDSQLLLEALCMDTAVVR